MAMSEPETSAPAADEVPGNDATADRIFAGAGEMRALCRALDWDATPLGPVAGWSHSLRVLVTTILATRHPMFLWWGPALVQFYNDAYRPVFGADERHPRALGACGREFWTDIWDVIGPQVTGVLERGEATWHEDQLIPILKNGRLEDVWWTYSYSPARDDDGCVRGVLVVCQDTTASVQLRHALFASTQALDVAKSRLTDVLHQAPGFVAVLQGPDHVYQLANDEYYRTVGRRELVGKPVREALAEIVTQGFLDLLDEVFRTGVPFVGREVPITLQRTPGSAGETLYVNFVYQPLLEADGTSSGVVVHGTDVTEQVMARQEVERLLLDSERARIALAERDAELERLVAEALSARAAAESANRAKDDFLALVGHELRSPLAGIANNAQMMALEICGPVTVKQHAALARINRSQEHLLSVIEQLLDLKQIAAGRLEYDVSRVMVSDALDGAAMMWDMQFEHMKIGFERARVDEGLAVMADPRRLRQILLNLLSNASKFTAAGRTVSLAGLAADESVHFVVRDTGIGIPASEADTVFLPFVQVRDMASTVVGGTGLGLAISRDMARGMGGDLTMESVHGEGSRFVLSLPRAFP